MPVSDHVVNERKGFGGEDVSSHGQATRKTKGGRRCVRESVQSPFALAIKADTQP